MDNYTLIVCGRRPWTTNQERKKGSHYVRSEQTKWWRQAFCIAAEEANIPHFDAVTIHVTPILPDRKIQDTGACYPTAKAAIDGLVDAGVLDDDAPKYVPTITFHAPVLSNYAGLEVLIIPEIEDEVS